MYFGKFPYPLLAFNLIREIHFAGQNTRPPPRSKPEDYIHTGRILFSAY